ncbi:uncharacterized protein BO80DRAFT_437073 [Aspergillus ibericus CBS 121593]|uniref:Uncharacterized protein n=1 Tax=Aspergillus ibericus CBS 121593 TaxID=1448316 RepID=A0A395GVV5_9EURO|nr:hypothetical protein BO80DRAFT_437073 [Aspergillus ibericus CBS 121593]RAK98203.1 hypothetical protein BO80DRAFT_437073 [Aspergillus ibericus CBS 121593]
MPAGHSQILKEYLKSIVSANCRLILPIYSLATEQSKLNSLAEVILKTHNILKQSHRGIEAWRSGHGRQEGELALVGYSVTSTDRDNGHVYRLVHFHSLGNAALMGCIIPGPEGHPVSNWFPQECYSDDQEKHHLTYKKEERQRQDKDYVFPDEHPETGFSAQMIDMSTMNYREYASCLDLIARDINSPSAIAKRNGTSSGLSRSKPFSIRHGCLPIGVTISRLGQEKYTSLSDTRWLPRFRHVQDCVRLSFALKTTKNVIQGTVEYLVDIMPARRVQLHGGPVTIATAQQQIMTGISGLRNRQSAIGSGYWPVNLFIVIDLDNDYLVLQNAEVRLCRNNPDAIVQMDHNDMKKRLDGLAAKQDNSEYELEMLMTSWDIQAGRWKLSRFWNYNGFKHSVKTRYMDARDSTGDQCSSILPALHFLGPPSSGLKSSQGVVADQAARYVRAQPDTDI